MRNYRVKCIIVGTHTWKKINVDGSHLARGGHVMFEFGDYLYILGGYDGTRMSDLWRISKLLIIFFEVTKFRKISPVLFEQN